MLAASIGHYSLGCLPNAQFEVVLCSSPLCNAGWLEVLLSRILPAEQLDAQPRSVPSHPTDHPVTMMSHMTSPSPFSERPPMPHEAAPSDMLLGVQEGPKGAQRAQGPSGTSAGASHVDSSSSSF